MSQEILQKKRIFSGIQPTGGFTLGNYLGALKNWVSLQEQYECIYCIVDLHAITVAQVPAELRAKTRQAAALTLACGIDEKKSILFLQSHVSAHAELAWALGCCTSFGELSRMTQFKDKSKKHSENINSGLFTYPVLMAADILAYNAHLVPVGVDQKQHLELARNIAIKFNNQYSDTFIIPDGYIPKVGAKIMSLQEPTAKMSKSDENQNAYIMMLDDKDTIIRKLKRAVTDSGSEVIFRDDKPAVSNLITIYSAVSDKTIKEVEKQFSGALYGEFKVCVGEAIYERLAPIQARYKEIIDDKTTLDGILKEGAQKASYIANKNLRKVYKKLGFVQL